MFIRFSAAALLFLATLIFLSPSGFSQPGPGGYQGGGKGGGKGKGKGGFGDPKDAFAKMADGRDFFLVSEANQRMQESLAKFAEEQGIKDGKITLEKYLLYREQRQAAWAANPDAKGFMKKKSDGAPTKADPTKTAEKPVDRSMVELRRMAEEDFKRVDRNGDGVLNEEEMHPTLLRELIFWDKNKDGLIDKEEYIPYFIEHYLKKQKDREDRARAQAEQSSGSSGRIVIEEDLDTRPVVFRVGKLPKELPDWFEKLDTNQDGLVSLGEWRKDGRSFEDFKAIDRNEDGLLTPEEVLGFLAEQNGTQVAGANGNGGNGSAGAAAGQPTNGFAAWMAGGFNRGRQGGPPRDGQGGGGNGGGRRGNYGGGKRGGGGE